MPRLIKVLSIDGGGIRGIIPAMVLAEIERRCSKPIAKIFDLIAGTSTGGILALGLTKPNGKSQPQYSAEKLIKLYENKGKQIFDRSIFRTFKLIPEGTQPLVKRKYPSRGIEEVLHEYFQETNLSEALKEVLITSYDIEQRSPYFFKRSKALKSKHHDFPMQKVARATSAAPTYFEPLKLETSDPLVDYYALIDGGVFANNPALCAYVEAKTTFPDATDFLVVSLGTGELAQRLPYDEVKEWGIIQWAQPMLNVTFDGVSDTVDYQLRELLPVAADGSKRYYRLQTDKLERGNHIDDASEKNIHSLKLLAQEIINNPNRDLDKLCDLLKQTAPSNS
jgi:patatin-like phospholipase/acyl hydrolase